MNPQLCPWRSLNYHRADLIILDAFAFFFEKNGPLFVYFRSFDIPIQMTNIQFEQYKLKKHRWCAWDSNPGHQDGMHKRIHWAMATPLSWTLYSLQSVSFVINKTRVQFIWRERKEKFKMSFESDRSFKIYWR